MVYSDSDRTADFEFAYTSSGDPGVGYPTWSGTGITANDGDLTGAFSEGEGEYDITITYANGATETVTVEVVDEAKISPSFSTGDPWFTNSKDKIIDFLETVTGKDVSFDLNLNP